MFEIHGDVKAMYGDLSRRLCDALQRGALAQTSCSPQSGLRQTKCLPALSCVAGILEYCVLSTLKL